jgi:hypothetical protein
VRNVKIRSFILPSQTVELEAQLATADGVHQVALAARSYGKPVATGRLELAPKGAA